MKKGVKLFIIFILIVIIAIMAWFKAVKPKEEYSNIGGNSVKEENIDYEANVGKMPVLLELSSPTCGPCRKMTPIIKEVKEKYKDTVNTHIIDLTKNPEFWRKIIKFQWFQHKYFWTKRERYFLDMRVCLQKKKL
ncbi:thioredoxin [Clostridium botulinum H04402 065]|nr:thioredoxin domain-containing protein [Clostridium botulinum]CBZ03625.1 thioredoxin [Clostridium botulinum H04402 065]